MRTQILIFLSLFIFFSCEKKRYSDYNENDFIETQGIVTDVKKTSDVFDSPHNLSVKYAYFLEKDEPFYGNEDLDLQLKQGQPIIILVNKKDDKISFFARTGIIDENLWKLGLKKLIETTNNKNR